MKPILQLVLSLLIILSGVDTLLYGQDPIVNYSFSGNVRDEASGQTAKVNAAGLTQDRHGWAASAFKFDGAQSSITAPNLAEMNSDFTTVAFWTNAASIPAQGEVFLLSFGGWQERWKISVPSHGKVVWTTNNSSGISDMDSGDGNLLAVDTWQHWVFVHDGTNDIIYLNGSKIAEKAVSGTLNDASYDLGIGYNNIDNGNYFHGDLDEVRIYDHALTDAEIQSLYTAQSSPASIGDTRVAFYSLNGSGKDEADYRNDLELSNTKSATDRFGFGQSAVSFDGVSSEATASNHEALNSSYTTIGFWIKPNSLPASGEAFILSNGGWQERLKISVPNHGKVVFTTNGSGGISDMDAGDGNELSAGQWAHVVMVHDGTNDKIFINGALANSKAVSGTLNKTTHPLSVGYNVIDGGNYFDGVIDDVEIYNYAMTDVDIAAWYTTASAFPGTVPDLVAYYKFAGDLEDETMFSNGASGPETYFSDRFGWGGNSLILDGTSGVSASNSIQLNSESVTTSFWVYPNELPLSGEVMLLSNGGWQERFKISLPSHGKVVFTTNGTGGISDMDSGDGNDIKPGQWTHVATVHDGTNDKIYINGVLVATKAVAGSLNSTKYPLGIGYDPIDDAGHFNGQLDDVQIYNKALSDAEVQALYNAQNIAPVVPGDLIANYTFSGNTSDATGYKNHAVNQNAQLGADRFGKTNKAYSFNGIDAQLTAANSSHLYTDNTTISFWVNVNNLPQSGEAFLLTNGGWQQRWKISLPGHGKPVFTTNSSSGISDMDSGDGNDLKPGQWTHVVMSHDGTNDKIYFNGEVVASKPVSGTLNLTSHPLGIGYNAVDGGNYFDGSLDEVRIYNRALSDQEVKDLYDEQSTEEPATDTQAPDAPLNLSAKVEFTNIDLAWRASSDNVGVTGYNVYVDGNKSRTVTTTDTRFEGLAQLTEYVFGVSAIDAEGNESDVTTLKAVSGEDETPDTTPPTVPGNLSGSAGSNSVLLSWDPSVDDRSVEGYVVSVDGDLYDTIPGTATSILVGGLDPETPYSFEIYAFDKAGNNSAIAEITLSTEEELETGEPGMVAHYPFDGNADDATPYANHGVIGGNPVFETPDHPNGGSHYIKFDGDQDTVLASNAVQLLSDFVSFGFWIRLDDVNIADAESYIIDFGHWNERMKISMPQHTKIVFTTNSKTTQIPNHIVDMDSGDGNEIVKGHWWHVVMTHDGVENKIYVNGVLANTVPAPGTLNSTSLPLAFGGNPVEGGQYFNGGLDEVKIYNRALTDAEVTSLFNGGTIGNKVVEGKPDLVDNVFPTPTSESLFIRHGFNTQQALTIRVFDIKGRQVDQLKYNQGQIPQNLIEYDASRLNQGEYFLNFVSGNQSIGSVKFTKI